MRKFVLTIMYVPDRSQTENRFGVFLESNRRKCIRLHMFNIRVEMQGRMLVRIVQNAVKCVLAR